MAFYRINVVGTKPLLCHNPLSMNVDKKPGRGSKVPEPADEAERGVYRNENGECCIRGEAFVRSMFFAGSEWKVPGKRASMKARLAHIDAVDELVVLRHPDGTPIKDYTIDRRRVVVQRSGIVRARPRFDAWQASFLLEYDEQIIDRPDILGAIAEDAGRRIGLGDYRPRFGRFAVTSAEVVEQQIDKAA